MAERKNVASLSGGSNHQSLGVLRIRVPMADDIFLPMDADVVVVNVPVLFGLDALDVNKMYVNNVSNELV